MKSTNLLSTFFQTSNHRYQCVDVARGIGFAAMFIYHIFFFANMYGIIHIPITSNIFWVIFQKSIASTFFFLVGISLYLAYSSGVHYQKFFKRLSIVFSCALIVTATSLVFFSSTPVLFGILHAITVYSVLGLFFLRFHWLNIFIALPTILVGAFYSSPLFNHTLFHWFGLATHQINALDYQPLFPWFGVVLLGISASRFLQESPMKNWRSNSVFANSLTFLGQHTLFLYMAHVPLILLCMEIIRY